MDDTKPTPGTSNPASGAGTSSPNFNFTSPANASAEQIRELVEERFRYKPWDEQQKEDGKAVTDAAVDFGVAIMSKVPPCPTRTRALNLIEEARMLANAAITHGGKF
ncbi:MAG TPA: hypothetical protein VF761_16980 [Gemmatimonadaceae bacterium]